MACLSLRRFLSISVLAVVTAAFASADPLLFEDFNYPTGPLDGQNGGTGWTGSWNATANFSVAPGSLSYCDATSCLQQSGNRAQFIPTTLAATNATRTISSIGPAGSTFWLSYLISFDGALGQNQADFRIDSNSQHLDIGRPSADETNWSVLDGGSATPYTQSSIPIVPGQALFVVMRIDQNVDPNANDTVSIYLDPHPASVPSASPGVPFMVINDLNFNSSNVTIGLDGSAYPTTGFVANYDPIRGGTTYADVAPAVTTSAVPEPATWSFLAGLFAVIAVAVRRRPARA